MFRLVRVTALVLAFSIAQIHAQDYQIIDCPNAPSSPPAVGVCEVTPGDSHLLVEATLLTRDAVLKKAHLLIDPDGMIACASCDCSGQSGFATATRIICAEGVVSPGLINLHDHIDWADSPPVDHGNERYDHRHDWRKGLRGHTKLTIPSSTSDLGPSWSTVIRQPVMPSSARRIASAGGDTHAAGDPSVPAVSTGRTPPSSAAGRWRPPRRRSTRP